MKIARIVLRVLLMLVLLMPVAGFFGFFPPPTAEMFTPEGWAFMSALMQTGYMTALMALTSFICVVLLAIGRTALAAIILAPFTVNVIAFHWFLDAAPIGSASIPAYVLLILNAFFLWENRNTYRGLWS